MHQPEQIIAAAKREFEHERFRAAVEAEKARLRAHQGRSIWRRFVDALPFTITWKRK